jgi:hypothetical protein
VKYKRDQINNNNNNNNNNTSLIPVVNSELVLDYVNSVENWEEAVESITYVEKSKLPGLVVYVKWKNGLKSVHHSTEVYHKCPQKILDYFEQYRQFKYIVDE